MRMSLSGTPSYSNTSSFTSAASFASSTYGVAGPVEQHVEHRLLVHPREARRADRSPGCGAAGESRPTMPKSIDRDAVAGQVEDVAGMRDRRGRSRRPGSSCRIASAPRAASSLRSSPAALTAGEVGARDADDVLLHVQRLAGPLGDRPSGSRRTGSLAKCLREALDVARLDARGRARARASARTAPRSRPAGSAAPRASRTRSARRCGARMRRSASIFARMPGRRILSTTGVPSCSFARCTCAIDAEPYGSRLEIAEHLERRAAERALELGQQLVERRPAGPRCAASRTRRSSRGGKRSTRVAITCPSFTNVGPSSSSARRMRCGGLEPHALDRRAPVEDLPGALEHVGDADAADDVAEAVADEDRADLVEAREVPHHPDGFPQHQRSLPRSRSCPVFRRRRAQRIGHAAEDAARDQRRTARRTRPPPPAPRSSRRTTRPRTSARTRPSSSATCLPVCGAGRARALRSASRSSGCTLVAGARRPPGPRWRGNRPRACSGWRAPA